MLASVFAILVASDVTLNNSLSAPSAKSESYFQFSAPPSDNEIDQLISIPFSTTEVSAPSLGVNVTTTSPFALNSG